MLYAPSRKSSADESLRRTFETSLKITEVVLFVSNNNRKRNKLNAECVQHVYLPRVIVKKTAGEIC